MDICVSCHGGHDITHRTKMIRVEYVQPQKNTKAGLGTCTHCSRAQKYRVQCESCPASLCTICLEESTLQSLFHKNHISAYPDHRVWTNYVNPFCFVEEVRDEVCNCDALGVAVGHCSRCLECKCFFKVLSGFHKSATLDHSMNTFPGIDQLISFAGIPIGTTLHWCKTCRTSFGTSQQLCDKCYAEEDPEHGQEHTYQRILPMLQQWTPEKDLERQNGDWQCLTCDESE